MNMHPLNAPEHLDALLELARAAEETAVQVRALHAHISAGADLAVILGASAGVADALYRFHFAKAELDNVADTWPTDKNAEAEADAVVAAMSRPQ